MTKIIVLSIIILYSFTPDSSEVYICKSKGGKKYHYSENCRGHAVCTNTGQKELKKGSSGAEEGNVRWEE